MALIEEHTIAAVARAFDVSGEFESAARYGSGHIHDTYSVKFNEGGRGGAHIILQHINTKIFRDPVSVMENIRRVTTHISARLDGVADADRRVLQLVLTRTGRAWYVDE